MEDYLSAKQAMKVGMRGYKDIVNVNWHGVIVQVRTLLSRSESMDIVNSIIDMCSDQDGNIISVFVDFAIRANIIMYYTNVELPEDIDELYTLLYYSNLYDSIIDNINSAQIKSILGCFHFMR